MVTDGELTLDECRKIQLSILDAFHDHCLSHGLTYYLAYGTLLGAVRHHGYIPWDDDIDVMMPREDYERLRGQGTKVALYEVRGGVRDKKWPFPFIKISDPGSRVDEGSRLRVDIGINIDVFPIDNLPLGHKRTVQRHVIRLLTTILAAQALAPRDGRSVAKRVISRFLSSALGLIPRSFLVRQLERIALGDQGATEACGVLVGSYQWSAPLSAFATPGRARFESTERHVPSTPSSVLTSMYGAGYMELPSIDDQVTHHTFRACRR